MQNLMRVMVFSVIMLTASNGLAQAPSNNQALLQSLLAEVHELRGAIQAMTAASHRVQIALYRLQAQETAVAQATTRLDTVRARCLALEDQRKAVTVELQEVRGEVDSGTTPGAQLKETQRRLNGLKALVDGQSADVSTCQSAEAEASGQLQSERTKLTDIQERVERLDKAFEKLDITR